MICPHCLELIDDDVTVCPHCHESVDGSAPAPQLIFCEGCGARLSSHDRTCPKCGRPAPGILSTAASASDLAAGKTASFPRLTQAALESKVAHPEPVSVQSVINDSLDASATSVLNRDELESRAGECKGKKSDIDPYHPRKRPVKALVAVFAVIVIIGGGSAFVALDPLGVMPQFYDYIERQASAMFPSRAGMGGDSSLFAEDKDEQTQDSSASDEESDTQDAPLTDDEVYAELEHAYESVVAVNDGDRFADVIDSFNTYYLSSSYSARKQASLGAYALASELQSTVDELGDMQLADDSPYIEQRDHVKQLAQWMFERVNVICESWDVSLGYSDGESPSAHEDEILKPMREAGSTAQDSYYEYVDSWKPVKQ